MSTPPHPTPQPLQQKTISRLVKGNKYTLNYCGENAGNEDCAPSLVNDATFDVVNFDREGKVFTLLFTVANEQVLVYWDTIQSIQDNGFIVINDKYPFTQSGGRKKLEKCTIAELRMKAAQRKVKLTGLTKKADIIAKLRGKKPSRA